MRPLFAYLDGASASAIVSMILGGVAAIGVALRYRWNQFLRFLHIRKPEDEATQAPAAPPTAEAEPPAREPVETK
jgi:hypothetical protein